MVTASTPEKSTRCVTPLVDAAETTSKEMEGGEDETTAVGARKHVDKTPSTGHPPEERPPEQEASRNERVDRTASLTLPERSGPL